VLQRSSLMCSFRVVTSLSVNFALTWLLQQVDDYGKHFIYIYLLLVHYSNFRNVLLACLSLECMLLWDVDPVQMVRSSTGIQSSLKRTRINRIVWTKASIAWAYLDVLLTLSISYCMCLILSTIYKDILVVDDTIPWYLRVLLHMGRNASALTLYIWSVLSYGTMF